MAEKITFKVTPRTVLGKNVKKLRREGTVPGNVLTQDGKSVAVAFGEHAFVKIYDRVGDTGLFYVEIEGEKTSRPVLLEDVQANPLSGSPIHVVFKQVNLKEKVEAEVPVELVGENKVPGAVVVKVVSEVTVEALPTDLPEAFEVDISGLTEIGQTITYANLTYDKSKVTLMVSEEELETPVVMLDEVKEEVVEESAPVEGELPANTEAVAAEGEEAKSTEAAGE